MAQGADPRLIVRIRLNRPTELAELATELRAGDCDCEAVAADTLAVVHACAADARQAGVELAFFLGTWLLGRPGLTAELLP